jgi:hypothetical protein
MKMTLRYLATLFLSLVFTGSEILAQTGNKPSTSVKTQTSIESTAKTPRSKADELREQQLRVFQEHVLASTIDSIKKMDEAGLRLHARNQILTYLTKDKTPSDQEQALATQIALDALADLREHAEELNAFMFSYLSSDLRSWIQKYRLNLTEDFEKAVKANVKVDASEHIRSLFELEDGDILAARRIRQELENHGQLDGLHFWLDDLMTRKSKEFEPIASEVVARAERGQISFDNLFWASHLYLDPQVSATLRNRFLAAVVTRTQPANFVAEPAPQMAYDLLTTVLPYVQQSLPDLYEQALNQHVAMRASLSEKQLAEERRIKRLKESANPIDDLLSDADLAKTKSERNVLLLRAAELAVEKKKFDLCLDVLSKIEVDAVAAEAELLQYSIDRVLQIMVKTVLADKRTDLAEKAAARISSPFKKVESLSLTMRYLAKANEKAEAQRVLTEASKVAASGPDDMEKARAFFLLSLICDAIDITKKPDLLLSGIKVLNNLTNPDFTARDKTIYQNYVQRLDNMGYALTRSFKGLAKTDQNSALALVEKLQKRDLRTFALIGILEGLDGLLSESSN